VTLRIGFIGGGQMARHHLAAIGRAGVPATIAGVYDGDPACGAEFAALADTQSFASVEALLAEARPDVVHVCTPPAAHFAAATAALSAGAHVYVEKPFALTAADARVLLDLAQSQDRLVCAGHQLLCDPAFESLMARLPELGTLVQADSHFAFRPVGIDPERGSPRALAKLLVDILPHPLYALIAVLERLAPAGQPIELTWAKADATDVQAILRAGSLVGRLSVSLRARPVASTLTLTGTRGSLSSDFVRSMVIGAANSGTEALEKILNPIVEGTQLMARTCASVTRRLRFGVSYPGLAELIGAFYRAVASGGSPPLSPDHLLLVSEIFENLVSRIDAALPAPVAAGAAVAAVDAPLTVVTGAAGFLGSAITRALPRVRGIGRRARPDTCHVQEWVTADLSRGLSADALAGANVVVHAAAETAGGYEAHQRNSIDATRHLLHAMHQAGVKRLVLVSSLSVLRPPRTPWERQDENTPRPDQPRRLGAYTWGKTEQEALVEREAASLGIRTRVIRPGALIDRHDESLPGLLGRRLFGQWHLGMGRPQLPIAVCDVDQCGEAIAWCATHFDDAAPIVNLFDPTVGTRGEFLARRRAHGWSGRVIWVPISALALGLTGARVLLSLAHGRWPERLAAWSILRPRRYDSRLAAATLGVVTRDAAVPRANGVAVQV
jgi:predicted dehydrogenase/nucleoside-diphosphate-sugar epimerase